MPEINDLSIFGDYKHVENKVTSALLHIFATGKEELIRHIIVANLKKRLLVFLTVFKMKFILIN